VIDALEDAEDCKAFEAAIIADYDARSAVERNLVLLLEHDPEKACPRSTIREWIPLFGKDHAQTRNLGRVRRRL
jgi:hypothetical protein